MAPIVLIAEDDPLTRMDLVETFSAAGYSAVETESADEAWDVLQARDDICCLFTDIQMPGKLDGLQLAAEVKTRWPDKAVMIGSAHLRPIKMPVGAVFLPKPYQLERVVRVMTDLHSLSKK